MDVLKAIFDSVFNIVVSCFNAIDIDLFGVGFTILDYFIAVLLLALVFRFLGKSLSVSDQFNLLSLDIGSITSISNNNRERYIIKRTFNPTGEGITITQRVDHSNGLTDIVEYSRFDPDPTFDDD